ncbi:Enoyl-CoA hydratase/carnithine racemase [Oceanospirillum multiglobuliferum]|uniref:Enoyl-CoA hydratase domain-containing protein 3, mitochondrial n=1 Tax=Oceanospirillum multiglobuliferum TaxID=64969 RepID=A0A1T4KJL2_9GAMM|nr:enoyl-CoA hydratase [Oceanospirillum multiglobuliferum]OPX56052.1 enoyl-CoA hydratase [Oceanospirillum multiglobuliferum]SJZ42565.1 Enoyl-CoA hydratase/carnithine racemase [Oceanospirillum multiglobuliferum]
MTGEALVLRQDSEGIAHLTLNRAKAYNALSLDCMQALIQQLQILSEDKTIKVVILSGAGNGFCAGHDLREMNANPSEDFYQTTFSTCAELMSLIQQIPQPVIAQVHGIATAAGCQLVATCDLAYAADNARFSTPGVNIGLFCSTPMVALTRAVHRKQAMEMLLTGEMINAERAVNIGLVNATVPEEQLADEVLRVAQIIAAKSSYTLKVGKEAFYQQAEMNQQQAYAHCSRVMTENMLAQDAQEGIDAFLTKRSPCWQGR